MNTTAPRHSVSVAATIVDSQGRILAVQRRDNARWEPPGGVLELGESIDHGLRREVEEETGLLIEPEALTGVYKNMRLGIVALVFRCRITGGVSRTSDETSRLRWMTPDEVRQNMAEAYAVRVLDALNDGPPAIRAHDGRILLHA
ncbi:NUDIX hydrolase [Candidatus Protofrankia californiensis]|uniref:NUDIX hydrolase n=1 Tax=Candidatus Protofrankia californiensis TaxID=1839754 RepID=A0A1C3PA24_9ACTN|nr:NUDIX hydrolase [Candidatus Protofrankia californiensis]